MPSIIGIDLATSIQKQLRDFNVTITGGIVKRNKTTSIDRIHIGAGFDQHLSDIYIIISGSFISFQKIRISLRTSLHSIELRVNISLKRFLNEVGSNFVPEHLCNLHYLLLAVFSHVPNNPFSLHLEVHCLPIKYL